MYTEKRRGYGYGGYIRRAKRIHARRSDTARYVDERLKAPTASSFEQWENQPNRYDLPNVDTPKRKLRNKSTFFLFFGQSI